ncbi:MAG: molybdopterin molybdotransferase MoeA [Xanthomonadaceae bacterium]|nr:molybdopterin molybdotransferase MoeA [Xanthomonadaceae bacterium]
MAEQDAIFPTGLGVEEARAHIAAIAGARKLSTETVALSAASGRILATDVVAAFDVPGFANSAMDGFALRAADLPPVGEKCLALIGEVFAGGHAVAKVEKDTCVRITTGAALPEGADTVVMKENTRIENDRVIVVGGARLGANVRPAGEDYRAGETALTRGRRLGPAQLGVLASLGMTDVSVVRNPRAVLLTTGDELVAPGEHLGFGQIHDSNRYSLGGLLESLGVELLRHERVRDDPVALRDVLLRAAGDADLIVSSGGVSAGEADFLPLLVAEIGKVHFWKVRIKPGMPFLFGQIGHALLFALPGNPVSGFATCLTLMKPAIHAMSAATDVSAPLRARLRNSIDKRHARAELQRARLECDAQAMLWATSHAKQGSGMLRGVAEADALIVLPEGERCFAAGELVDVLPLPGWPE